MNQAHGVFIIVNPVNCKILLIFFLNAGVFTGLLWLTRVTVQHVKEWVGNRLLGRGVPAIFSFYAWSVEVLGEKETEELGPEAGQVNADLYKITAKPFLLQKDVAFD